MPSGCAVPTIRKNIFGWRAVLQQHLASLIKNHQAHNAVKQPLFPGFLLGGRTNRPVIFINNYNRLGHATLNSTSSLSGIHNTGVLGAFWSDICSISSQSADV